MPPTDLPRVRLVAFDLGGVLVRITRTWAEACELAGVPFHDPGDAPAAWAARMPWIHAYETGDLSHADFLAGVAGSSRGAYAPEEIQKVHDVVLREEFPGIDRLLLDLEALGFPTAILSNTNAAHWDAIFTPSGAPRFPSVRRVRHPLASHLLRLRKPSPEIFARAEALTGVPGPEILYFDDLPENVVAARRSGWRAERVDPLGDPAALMREHLVEAGVLRG